MQVSGEQTDRLTTTFTKCSAAGTCKSFYAATDGKGYTKISSALRHLNKHLSYKTEQMNGVTLF